MSSRLWETQVTDISHSTSSSLRREKRSLFTDETAGPFSPRMTRGWSFVAALVATVVALQAAAVRSAPAYVREARNATNDPDCPRLTWESCCDIQRNMTENVSITVVTTSIGNSSDAGGNSSDAGGNSTGTNTTTNTTTTTTITAYPSGRYTLGHYGPFSATYGYCDLETDGGGWLVIFRRESELKFDRNLKEYEDGFGELEPGKSFWYGLKSLTHITNRDMWELRVDLIDGSDRVHAYYSNVSVGDASEGYALRLGPYMPEKSTASDSLHDFNGNMFFAKDNDLGKCAWQIGGGWWFGTNCGGVQGGILTSSHEHLHGWYSKSAQMTKNYARTEMKIRQVNCSV